MMDTPDSDDDTQNQLRMGEVVPAGFQENVNTHFDSTVSYWDRVYHEDDLQGRIYRLRQAAVLTYIDAIDLQRDARVLEIGCGAGHLTMQLAERELRVAAVDASPAMVELTAARASDAGFEQQVNVAVADVHRLPFESGEFEAVVAVGVLPWLHSPADAVREMARVLADDGQLVLTADNGARLTSFTDPRELLARTPLRRIYHAVRKRPGVAMSRLDFPRRIDRLVREGGMRTIERRTVGFGPLSFLGRPIFAGRRGIRLNDRLQSLADRGVPVVKSTGWHYVLRARRQ
jgi:ubiquinone/menaquinone biosynthesis C-methylase UbiE